MPSCCQPCQCGPVTVFAGGAAAAGGGGVIRFEADADLLLVEQLLHAQEPRNGGGSGDAAERGAAYAEGADERNGAAAVLDAREFDRDWPRYPDVSRLSLPPDVLDGCFVDLRPYASPTPYTVHVHAPLRQAFDLFRGLGLHTLVVVNDVGDVVGVLTRHDLTHDRMEEVARAKSARAGGGPRADGEGAGGDEGDGVDAGDTADGAGVDAWGTVNSAAQA